MKIGLFFIAAGIVVSLGAGDVTPEHVIRIKTTSREVLIRHAERIGEKYHEGIGSVFADKDFSPDDLAGLFLKPFIAKGFKKEEFPKVRRQFISVFFANRDKEAESNFIACTDKLLSQLDTK